MSDKYFFLTNQLNEHEMRVVTSIVSHIENDEGKVGIAQVAAENFVSTGFIMKMCKRLGYDGYTDFVYHLSQDTARQQIIPDVYGLTSLIDNYDEHNAALFCSLLNRYCESKLFVVGAGFADVVADYMVQRLAVSGFMVYNRVHFYDFMLFHADNSSKLSSAVEPSLIIAISQSGETDTVINDVMRAKENGFSVVTFTKAADSTLARLSDLYLLVDQARQTLLTPLPNTFFGKVILAFEELLGRYFLAPQNGTTLIDQK